ncbi:MAG TPA: HAD-IA family hydrolase, partial [Armatimonadota bacterium]
ACLSNTCAPHWADLTNAVRYPGIAALDFQHASHLFGVAKPDPAIYQLFEAATGQRSEEILFFDDRAENVAAAQACGWHAVQILPTHPAVAQIHAACLRYQLSLTS